MIAAPQSALPTGSKPLLARVDSVSALTDCLLLGSFLALLVPETLLGKTYVGEVPLPFAIFYLAIACAFIEILWKGIRRPPAILIATLVAALLMGLHGYLQSALLKDWVIDASMFSGLLLGLYWGTSRATSHAIRAANILNGATTLVFFLSLLGLATDVIPAAFEGPRRFSYSIFFAVPIVTTLIPVIVLNAPPGTRRSRFVAMAAFLLVVLSAIMSGTRSVVLQGLAAVTFLWWIRFRRNRLLAASLLVAVSAVIYTIPMPSPERLNENLLIERFTDTQVLEEIRYQELVSLFDDLRGHLILGRGFGSRFLSPVRISDDPWAIAPHVGAFAFWLKGGVLAFGFFIVLPAIIAAFHLLRLKRTNGELSCWAAAAVFLLRTFLSGGWDIWSLFLYGAALTLAPRMTTPPVPAPVRRRGESNRDAARTNEDTTRQCATFL